MPEWRSFKYEGPAYIRPVGRGIVLENSDEYLDEAIEALAYGLGSGGHVSIRVSIEIQENN
jgi:hypothetical protein